jgi:two-component system response regulator
VGAPIQVLVVEDNLGDVLLIRQALSDFPVPVKVDVARDGEEAMVILADSQFVFDVIILDLNLPKLSGLEILDRVGHIQLCPIVVFTSSLNDTERRRALDLGASDFVTKPIDFDRFTTAVSDIVVKWCLPGPNGTSCGSLGGQPTPR